MAVFRRCTSKRCRSRWEKHDRRCPKCGGGGVTWAYVIDVGKGGERRQRRGGGFATKAEAQRAERERLASLDEGRYVERSRLTLGEFLRDEWLPAMRPRLADKTWKEWGSALERYVYRRIGDLPLQELTAAHLSRLYAELIERGARSGTPLAPSTVRGVHTRLSQALGDAVRWRLLERNPAELADPPPARQAAAARRRAMRTWSGAELATFIRATTGHRFAAVWTLDAATGLRRSELLGLRWPAVDLEAGTLTVLTTLVETADGYVLVDDQKTPGSGRTIHLNRRTVELLRIHRRTQLEARLRAGPAWEDQDLVFCDEFGRALSPPAVTQAFRRAVIECGLPRIRLHDLRHTHATLMLKAGVNPKVVSERLGHSSVAYTLDTYAHVLPGMQPEAAELFDATVFGAAADDSDPDVTGGVEDEADP